MTGPVEIPLKQKYRQHVPAHSHAQNGDGHSGTQKAKASVSGAMARQIADEKAAQKARKPEVTLVLDATGKRRWRRVYPAAA